MKNLKLNKTVTWALTILMLALGCNPSRTDNKEQKQPDLAIEFDMRLGGFLPLLPLNNNIVDMMDRSVTIEDFDIPGFPKKMITYGTVFAVMAEVTDEFVYEVAQSFHEMFPQDPDLDLEMQKKVLNNMLQYRSLIPVLNGRYESLSDDMEGSMEQLSKDYSVCDIIMYRDGTGRQTMEVVEHLLHYLTSIGLHLTLPEDWSFSDPKSKVTQVMNQAIDAGLYDVGSYKDMIEEDKEVYQRVIVQEFSYWLISTYWDLQEPYGPMSEEEWNVDNKQDLLKKLPEGYDLVEQTVDRFMKSPSLEILEKFRKYN